MSLSRFPNIQHVRVHDLPSKRWIPSALLQRLSAFAGFRLQAYQAFFAFTTNVSNAGQHDHALMTDINLTVSALNSIRDLLKDEEGTRTTSGGRPLFSDDGHSSQR